MIWKVNVFPSPGDSVINKTGYFYFAQVSRLVIHTPDNKDIQFLLFMFEEMFKIIVQIMPMCR
jgi:hypothetical protein